MTSHLQVRGDELLGLLGSECVIPLGVRSRGGFLMG